MDASGYPTFDEVFTETSDAACGIVVEIGGEYGFQPFGRDVIICGDSLIDVLDRAYSMYGRKTVLVAETDGGHRTGTLLVATLD